MKEILQFALEWSITAIIVAIAIGFFSLAWWVYQSEKKTN